MAGEPSLCISYVGGFPAGEQANHWSWDTAVLWPQSPPSISPGQASQLENLPLHQWAGLPGQRIAAFRQGGMDLPECRWVCLGVEGAVPLGQWRHSCCCLSSPLKFFFSTGPVHGPQNNKRLSSVNRGVCISYMLEKKSSYIQKWSLLPVLVMLCLANQSGCNWQ